MSNSEWQLALARKLATKLFEVGSGSDPSWPCTRIQFMSRYHASPGGERAMGGLCFDSLVRTLADAIAEQERTDE